MPDFGGVIISGINVGIPASRPAWIGILNLFQNESEVYIPVGLLFGTTTDNTPISFQSRNIAGALAGGYGDIFYNRILIDPLAFGLGLVASNQVILINVFNAFFEDRTLLSIDSIPVQGISISGPPLPLLFRPLNETGYSVEVDRFGPPQIDTIFRFIFDDGTVLEVQFTGRRVLVMPYLFGAPMIETLEWNTQLITSNDGTEQRVRLRDKPRQQFQVEAVVLIDDLSRGQNLIYSNRTGVWGLPLWGESIPGVSVSSDDITVFAETRYSDFRVGRLAMLWKNEREQAVFEIESVADDRLTATLPFGVDFTNIILVPLRVAFLDSDPSRLTTGYTGNLQMSYTVIDNINLGSTPSPIQFNGMDVFLRAPLLEGDGITDSYVSRVDRIDFDTGIIERVSRWTQTKIGREISFILDGQQDIWEFRLWLHRRAGRTQPFYMPTFENDLRLVPTDETIISEIIVESDSHVNFVENRVHIAILTRSQGWLLVTAQGFLLTNEGNTVIPFLPLVLIDPQDVDRISFMGLKRLDSDLISIEWMANNVAGCTIPILEYEP